eukprot:scaffold3430_cov162-Amphora_coffeaeformis.AAC.5
MYVVDLKHTYEPTRHLLRTAVIRTSPHIGPRRNTVLLICYYMVKAVLILSSLTCASAGSILEGATRETGEMQGPSASSSTAKRLGSLVTRQVDHNDYLGAKENGALAQRVALNSTEDIYTGGKFRFHKQDLSWAEKFLTKYEVEDHCGYCIEEKRH